MTLPYGGSADSVDPVTADTDPPLAFDDPTRDDSADVGNPGLDPGVPFTSPNATTSVDNDDESDPTDAEADFEAAMVAAGAWPWDRPPPQVAGQFTVRSPFYNDPALWSGESSQPQW